jgi:heme O synthase-like polyprenyltransferase
MSNPSAIRSWLQLFRAPNLFTAPGDPLAGYLIANQAYGADGTLAVVIGASLLFYSGGLLLNDIADIEEDRRERPNRPLPSGAVSRVLALTVAMGLFGVALVLCWVAGGENRALTVTMGSALLISIISYNLWTKHLPVAGALNMGACRTLSILVGASAGPGPIIEWAVIPAVLVGLYIAAVTNLARHETKQRVPVLPRVLPAVVIFIFATAMISLAFLSPDSTPATLFFGAAVLYVLILAVRMFRETSPLPPIIGSHIRTLLLLQAGLCWLGQPHDAGRWAAVILTAFIPLSYFTARRFYAS